MNRRVQVAGRAVVAAGLVLLAGAGCGRNNDGPSEFEKREQERQDKTGTLAAAGVKMTEKQYPVGRGWVADMRGVTVTDDMLKDVKSFGNIAEVNLSKSTVTDEHLRTMHDLQMHVVLAKLDLSDTAVTDAGLDHLEGNVFLMELNVKGTKVTSAGVSRFLKARQANPQVKFRNTKVIR